MNFLTLRSREFFVLTATFVAWSGFAARCGRAASAQPTTFNLDSGTPGVTWQVAPQTAIGDNAAPLSQPTYNASRWLTAQVPGTVYTSYVAAGLEKDPNFGDNIYQVDKKKYDRDFWYRATFRTPANRGKSAALGQRVWLNFEGINRKGEVYFNGVRLGVLDGFMARGKFDITALLRRDQPNVLAALVRWPGVPVANRASPTYISSAGWDWMPYVPGLLSGITDDVSLSTSGPVTMVDPWIRTTLPTLSKANVSVQMEVANHTARPVTTVVKGTIQPGNVVFTRSIVVPSQTKGAVTFDAKTFKQLVINNPKLWWPNGYGAPNLYRCDLTLSTDGQVSDRKNVSFGIKQYSYDTKGDVFHLHINGKPIFVKGGNWGMSEYLLRCRGAEYDLKAKLHRDMNFNMIRNWIGSTTDEEFYEACDKYGIMVWDDFWLNSNPNLPEDINAFNLNAIEKIKRMRNHPSIAVWCGDNEGVPQAPLNDWLRADVKAYDGGDRWYQPRSNIGALSGSGPWTNFDPDWYFTKYPSNFSKIPSWGFRSEMGTAVFTNVESFKKFMPKDKWWPRNEMWNLHFFGPSAGNAGPDRYEETITRSYGRATGIEDWCRKAQLVNIESNKAMYEGWQHNMWQDASGILTWMSQSAYPSFVWQTYDYYYDLTGAYWGVKKACEPLHIQWNSGDNSVKVVNTTSQDERDLRAEARVFNVSGKLAPGMTVAKALPVARSNTATLAFDIGLKFKSDNLAYKVKAVSSSDEDESNAASAATDGGSGSRWSSRYEDNQWLYVDLGAPKSISQVNLIWESAYGKAYKVQVSDNATDWRDVYETASSDGGTDSITFPPTTARYVRMLGLKRASQWGYSLYEFEVYQVPPQRAPSMQFIQLKLKNKAGNTLSENFYWRSDKGTDYTALNNLPPVTLVTTSKMILMSRDGQCTIKTQIANPTNAVAFAIRAKLVRARDGQQILPAMMNDNYFSLMPGETKSFTTTFDQKLVGPGDFRLTFEPYNNRVK